MENSGHSHEHEHDHNHAHHQESSSLMKGMNPKQTFIMGLIGGFLVLSTVGFFIFLSMYLRGNMPSVAGNPSTGGNQVAGAPENTGPKNIALRDVDEKRDHVLGNKNAKVTLVEYADFECPYCQAFNPTVKQILQKYGKDVRLVYRHFPLSFHAQALPAAIASECASDQGKFWEMHDMMFDKGVVQTGSYTEYAKAIGLNTAKFDECVKAQKSLDKIREDQTDGQNAGLEGTPYMVIIGKDGQKVPVSGAQPFEAVDAAVQSVL